MKEKIVSKKKKIKIANFDYINSYIFGINLKFIFFNLEL